jgi:hypothetical protein
VRTWSVLFFLLFLGELFFSPRTAFYGHGPVWTLRWPSWAPMSSPLSGSAPLLPLRLTYFDSSSSSPEASKARTAGIRHRIRLAAEGSQGNQHKLHHRFRFSRLAPPLPPAHGRAPDLRPRAALNLAAADFLFSLQLERPYLRRDRSRETIVLRVSRESPLVRIESPAGRKPARARIRRLRPSVRLACMEASSSLRYF